MKKAMVILNPSSGKEEAEKNQLLIVQALGEMGYEAEVRTTEKEHDATMYAQTACKERFDAVISVGGDGTLNETINGLAAQEYRPALGVIPLGTVNDFARALDIPLNCQEAIEVLKQEHIRAVDIGKVNEVYFSNIVAVGGIAEAACSASIEHKTLLGPIAYLVEAVKTLVDKKTFQVRIRHDQGEWEGDSLLLLATLTNSGGGFRKMAPDAKIDDGLMRCVVVHDVPLAKFGALMLALLKGEHIEDPAVEYIHTSTLHISGAEPLISNLDGDEGPELPITIRVLQKHLNVFVPHKNT
jgi:YegS/Rv2252/BmrU family lipid kinase